MQELFDNVSKIDNIDFSLEKKLKLKSLSLAFLIMTRSNEHLDEFITLLTYKLRCDSSFRTNNDKYLEFIVDFVLSKGYLGNDIIKNYLIDGYLYHSFNGAFSDSIKEKGLILKEKPWDLNELENIREIFKKHGKSDVFGLYQGEEKTPIFMSKSIMSSSYYCVSSPTWFLHFTTGGMQEYDCDKEAYRNRDYEACLNNVIKMCKKYGLLEEETSEVINFFNKYYTYLGLNESPGVLLIKRDKYEKVKILEKENNENDRQYILRMFRFNCSGNIMLKENVDKDDILIIKYINGRRIEL